MIRAEKKGRIKKGKEKEIDHVKRAFAEKPCEDNQREKQGVLIKKAQRKFPPRDFLGCKGSYGCHNGRNHGKAHPPEGELPPPLGFNRGEVHQNIKKDKARQGNIKGQG